MRKCHFERSEAGCPSRVPFGQGQDAVEKSCPLFVHRCLDGRPS
jgi:hypothetical protein